MLFVGTGTGVEAEASAEGEGDVGAGAGVGDGLATVGVGAGWLCFVLLVEISFQPPGHGLSVQKCAPLLLPHLLITPVCAGVLGADCAAAAPLDDPIFFQPAGHGLLVQKCAPLLLPHLLITAAEALPMLNIAIINNKKILIDNLASNMIFLRVDLSEKFSI